MWADSDSHGEQTRPSFGGRSAKPDITAPINFVRGGVQQAGKKEEDGAGEGSSGVIGQGM